VEKAKLDSLSGGRFRLNGILDATTVADLLKQSEVRFAGQPQIEIDLAGVTESDSSGLALLIEWLRQARIAGQTVRFLNVPTQIDALARISEVDELFNANGGNGSGAATQTQAPGEQTKVAN
jgi:phospholipid transport system transporter-binding protein